jgi:glutathione S-transferase
MKLYWAPQTRAFRAVWMLEESGRPYERVLIDIRTGKQDDPAFRKVNPMGKVPALSDGEAMLAESAAICAYVAERCPEAGLAPAVGDPVRGRYLHWLFFAASCMEPAYTQKMTGLQIDKVQAGWASFEQVIDVLDHALQAGGWILGPKFSAADVMLGSDLWFGSELLKIVPPRPALQSYIARCAERPAFKRARELDSR